MMDHMKEALKRHIDKMKLEHGHDPLEGSPEEEAMESKSQEQAEQEGGGSDQEDTDRAPHLGAGGGDSTSGQGAMHSQIMQALSDGGTMGHHTGSLHAKAADLAKHKMGALKKKY